MLDEAGIRRADCFLTNVFNLRPKDNDLENICQKDRAGSFPPLKAGHYLRPEFHLKLLVCCQSCGEYAQMFVALGGTAVGQCLEFGISKIRGTVRPGQVFYPAKYFQHITPPPSSGTGPSAP
jgi:hypothetical protein